MSAQHSESGGETKKNSVGFLEFVELVVVRVAPFPGRGHFKDDGLDRDLDRRQGDLVAGAEVLDRFHLGIARVEQDRRAAHGGDAAHLLRRAGRHDW